MLHPYAYAILYNILKFLSFYVILCIYTLSFSPPLSIYLYEILPLYLSYCWPPPFNVSVEKIITGAYDENLSRIKEETKSIVDGERGLKGSKKKKVKLMQSVGLYSLPLLSIINPSP